MLLKTANWLNHLEYDWVSPLWAPTFRRLAASFRLIRYDGRGNGLSDREVADISFSGFESDLDAVTASIDLPRFSLLGISQGAATAIAYAVRHPGRVERLILYGGYAQGRNRRGSPEEAAASQAFLTILRQGWGDEHSAFMRAFSSIYLPSGSSEQIGWIAELQRRTTTADAAARIRGACDDIDVTALLAKVKAPTLVLHARRDNVVPLDQGRLIASRIPNARFVSLESENHVPLPGGRPGRRCWPRSRPSWRWAEKRNLASPDGPHVVRWDWAVAPFKGAGDDGAPSPDGPAVRAGVRHP